MQGKCLDTVWPHLNEGKHQQTLGRKLLKAQGRQVCVCCLVELSGVSTCILHGAAELWRWFSGCFPVTRQQQWLYLALVLTWATLLPCFQALLLYYGEQSFFLVLPWEIPLGWLPLREIFPGKIQDFCIFAVRVLFKRQEGEKERSSRGLPNSSRHRLRLQRASRGMPVTMPCWKLLFQLLIFLPCTCPDLGFDCILLFNCIL